MDTYNKISCFIIGEGTLPIQCGEILLGREHTIYGMISSDVAVRDWAGEKGIPRIDPKNKDIVTILSQHPFDYLFSIVNLSILPQQVLALPRRDAINFHDAPLPRYAGSYATSWAILQGERVHGVTWHAMTELVDAGDIFKQALFEIAGGETALTLNAKCYDAAISSFSELIDDLAYDRVSARKQNLSERTFFSRDKRPSPGCILSWKRSAREIDAFVRALDFGSSPNPLGHPKLALGTDFLIVSEIEVLNSMSSVPPGTVTHINADFVSVATLDGEIALRKLLTIDGQPLSIADFVAKFGLYEGHQFKELEQKAAVRITAYLASISQHEAFWTKRLATLENMTLPYMHQKTSHVPTAQCSSVPMSVPGEILTTLEDRYPTGHRADVLLAAFVAYLARLAGLWSFAIAYRDSELERDVADLAGLFAAYVPLHVSIEDQQSFGEVLYALQEQVQLTKKRKTYARDLLARSPTLRAKTNVLGRLFPSICVERVEALHGYMAPHGSELALIIGEEDGACLWVYDAEVLDEESVVQMQQGFAAFLHGIVADPQQRISNLPLLTEQERHRLLVEWNATATEYPAETCLPQLFEAQVERTPEGVAVVCEDKQLTYRELNQRANQLAHHLQQVGVGPEVLVGLCVERSLDMVVGLLGILKAGGAYVPLDPAFPAERLAFMLEDAQAAVLVTQQHLLARLPAHGPTVVCLDTDGAALAQQSEANPLAGATAAQLAYVIYTSGSTGKPKGVQILHRALVNFLLSMYQQPGLTAEDSWLAITTLSFDIAALELFLPLIVGARVIVASRETAADGTALAEALTRGRVSVMQATPVTWRLLLAAGWPGKADLKILCGGEALPLELAQQLLSRGASLWNLYGPTETTIWSTLCKIEPGDEVVTIGRPIANTQIYLLDAQLQPVPVGVPGELYIGGDGLARGYLKRPELTAERFLPHPFSSEPGTRLYRTGDLARYRADGTIEHLGRLDFQVKLRGFRIELGEIEAVLAQHPAVRQAVVMAREDVPGDKRLVAYLVASQQPVPTSSELRSFLQKQLPDYMLPSYFVFLEAFPLTPNGKVDRRALPAPDLTKRTAEETFVAPVLPLHHQLVQIWEELLDVRPIGIRDDFFALGGHSLLATHMISRIEEVFGKKLPLATLFTHATIEALANDLMASEGIGAQVPASAEDSDSRTPIIAVQTSGAKRPFFYLHGDWLYGAFYCLDLARYLGPDQPFYVLEPYRFDGLRVPPTFQTMAAAHIEAMRAVQQEGPYLLGGWCNGALIAYEMAQQLHAQEQKVDLLVLLDPGTSVRMNPATSVLDRLSRIAISRSGKVFHLGQDKQLDWFLRLRHLYRYLRFSHYRSLKDSEHLVTAEQLGLKPRREKAGAVFSRLDAMLQPTEVLDPTWWVIYEWISWDYLPQFYPGKLAIFWDSEDLFRRVAWRKVEAKEVEVHILPGSHVTSRTEYLPVLAEQLSKFLNQT